MKKRLITRPGMALMLLSLVTSVQADFPELFFNDQQRKSLEQQRQAYFNQDKKKRSDEPFSATKESIKLHIQAIFTVNGKRLVQINGEIYDERQQKNNIHVHRIYENYATLTLAGKWGKAKVGRVYESLDWPDAPEPSVKMQD